MKHFNHILSLLSLTLLLFWLSSCDFDNNFFHHPVEFDGAIEEPELVITAQLEAGKTPCVFVNRSFFFKDSTATVNDSILIVNEETGDTIKYWYGRNLNRGWLKDATVQMQIADGEWETLKGQSIILPYRQGLGATQLTNAFCYVSDRIMHEGDKVTVRVSHPEFKKQATVSQQIPLNPGATVTKIDTSLLSRFYGLADFELEIPEYKGADDDVMCFRAITYCSERLDSKAWVDYNNNYNVDEGEQIDTVYYLHYIESEVYSQGVGFSRYDNINRQLSRDYWGSNEIGLYHNANRYGFNTKMHVKAMYQPYYVEEYGTNRYTYTTDSVVLEVRILSKDAYLQNASMVAGNYYYVSVRDLWNNDFSYDFDDLLEEIQDVFNELGTLEGIQVFSNVDGGFGHIGASSVQRFVFVP